MRHYLHCSFARMKPIALAAFLAATPTIALAQDGDVVARVDGHEITKADVAVAEEMFGPQLGTMPDDAKLSVIVNALIELRIVSEAARGAGITDQDGYKRQMAFFDEQTLRSLFVDQQVAAAVTDEAVRAIYDQHVASLPKVQERRLRHILVTDEEKAREVVSALRNGEAFADLAEKHSLDAVSKANGGDLGFLAEDQIIPEIQAAVASMEAGQFTQDPVQTAFGFHVVQLEESRDRPAPAFEALAPQIRQSLEMNAERELIAGLRAGAQVEKLVPDVSPPQEDDGHDH